MNQENFKEKQGLNIKRVVVGILNTNCYLIYKNKEMIVIDPGGDHKKILNEIKIIGVTPKSIINTHSHPDHILANKSLSRATGASVFNDFCDEGIIKIEEEEITTIHSPGHSSDSFCFYSNGFLISGDVLFDNGHGRTIFPGGSNKQMINTLRKLKEKINDNVIVYPGHGEAFLMKDYPISYGCGKFL